MRLDLWFISSQFYDILGASTYYALFSLIMRSSVSILCYFFFLSFLQFHRSSYYCTPHHCFFSLLQLRDCCCYFCLLFIVDRLGHNKFFFFSFICGVRRREWEISSNSIRMIEKLGIMKGRSLFVELMCKDQERTRGFKRVQKNFFVMKFCKQNNLFFCKQS